ncbi:MAG: serpin family protein [Candidatus Diapherotrites archaeon]|nr:serpin family protein [Candidatus Diapherotrites archaeon]
MREILVVVLAVAVIGSLVLFLFPYNPLHPPRADETGATEEGIRAVVDANNAFAFDMYSVLSKEEGNVFFSPYSIFSAMAIVYEGAVGDTAEEIGSVLYFPSKEVLEPNFAAVYNGVNSRGVRTGNALWVQKGFPLVEEYVERVEKYYGGKAANVDFVNKPKESVSTINQFIEEQTNGKIKKLINENMITSLTRVIVTNAVYFKGKWKWQFDPSKTRDMEFHVSPEESVAVRMMYMEPEKAKFRYGDFGFMQMLELPYEGNMSMIILLPKQGKEFDPMTGEAITYNYTIEDVEKQLTLENFEKWRSEMKETKLDGIYLPRFETEESYDLVEGMKELGVEDAFDHFRADFSEMSERPLYIDFIVHKAYVKVDEEGTEAAAATAVSFSVTAVRKEKVFKADHPFVFLIQDDGLILFMGRVVDPTKT